MIPAHRSAHRFRRSRHLPAWLPAWLLSLALLAAMATAALAPAHAQTAATAGPGASVPGNASSSVDGLFGDGPWDAGSGGMCRPPEAGDPNPLCGSEPASQSSSGGVDTGAGNPINVINGNKYQREVDLPALPGELGLEIVRHYNSANRHVLGQLGTGWRLSYETELYRIGQSVQILQADGRRLIFAIDPDNPNQCASSDASQGWVQILQEPGVRNTRGYIWHWTHGPHAGRQLRFDARGKLVRITAASGAALSLTRGPRGELVQVTDPQGRRLIINHASRQRAQQSAAPAVFVGITSIDSPLGRFEYRHGRLDDAQGDADSDADVELTRRQAANLTQVRLPAPEDSSSTGITRHYHYEDARHPQALTGISVQGTGSDGRRMDERIASYRYDEQGRAMLSARGPVDADQPGPEQVQLSIVQPALYTRPGHSLLTNSLGQQTLYTHRIIGGEYRLMEAVGAGCARCGPVNVRYQYDEAGRLTEQTTLSPTRVVEGELQGELQSLITTRHTRDAQGLRVERIVHAQGQQPQLVERQEFGDPHWPDKPTLIARPSVIQGQEHSIQLTYNEAGQLTRLTESGYSPLTEAGELAKTLQEATRITRSTAYMYTRINGRSVLTRVDGPLANGPSDSPKDSDVTELQWDDQGSFIVRHARPGGSTSSIAYHPDTGLPQRVANDAGFATDFSYNARLQPVRISSQGPGWDAPRVQTLHYDALGRKVEHFAGHADDALRATDRWAWDVQGRLLWHANALGLLQTRSYDSEGQVLQSALQSATMVRRLSITYDALGRPLATTDNAGRTQQLHYGADGLPDAYMDPLGRVIAASRLQATPAHDADANASSQPLAKRPHHLYDDFGRQVLTASTDSGTTRRAFDAADRLITMTDARGNQARYAYDAQGRILEQTIVEAWASSGNDSLAEASTTRWRYDERHLLEVIHPSQSERFEYDARGLRSARIVSRPAHDGAPEITAITRYEHDATGQLVASTLPDGSRIVYRRNGQGQVVALKRQSVQTPWLRWLGKEQLIARDFERDLVGLKSYTAGNGIQATGAF